MNSMDLNRKLVTYLVLGHCFIIAISNYLVQFPINIFGLDYTIGTFTFPVIVLATDLTVRLSNEQMHAKLSDTRLYQLL